ncbi:MAG: hypothetical protein KGI51_13595, partial [Rhodospirillales bacterium]|nr:hypothetical protein [Rhodospirillales bacterium]
SGSGEHSGSGDQSGSACSTGSSVDHSGDHSGSGSSGSGDHSGSGDQSGSGCSTGSSGDHSGDHSGSGSSGSGDHSGSGDQSGSGCTGGTSGSGQNNACGSGISLNGTAPTGNLPTLYGTAQTLEFAYNAGNTVSLAAGSNALASVTGSNSASPAFMEITNSSNPLAAGSQIYFEGAVQAGENIFADATINPLTNTANPAGSNQFGTVSGAELFGFVWSSQAAFLAKAAPMQTDAYGTAGAMHLGDTIGSLKLVGYVGTTGGHLVS